MYSSEKVFTASSPDTAGGRRAGGSFCMPRFSRAAPFFAFCLFYAPCAPPCGRAHGARAACAQGGFFCAEKRTALLRGRKDRFCGRKGAFAAKRRIRLTFSSPQGNQVKINRTRPERRLLRALGLILIAILVYCCFVCRPNPSQNALFQGAKQSQAGRLPQMQGKPRALTPQMW